MSIQWYPGHMVKARRVLAEMIPSQDVIVEVLDARMPAASENPLLAQLRGGKPCLKVLSKADLADPAVTRAWLARYETGPRSGRGAVAAIATSTTRLGEAKGRILELCKRLAGNPTGPGRVVRAAVAGVPNVGKSTLINALAGRRVAAVGDTPGVTKASQQVVLNSGVALHDHPGLLWPRVDDETQALRLALGGALPGTTFDYENVALFGAKLFLERYPKLLLERFKLKELPPSADALLDEIGRRRGAIRAGGVIDRHKAAEVLLRDFRSGALGRISLETPDDALASSRVNLGAAGDAFMNDPLSVAPAGDAFMNDPLSVAPAGDAFMNDPLSVAPAGDAFTADPVSVAPAGEVPSDAHEESELPEDA